MSFNDTTAPDVTTALIEDGFRRQWTAASPAALIRMFAAAGFDVVRGYAVGGIGGAYTRDPNAGGTEVPNAREVMVDGRAAAWIIWHPSVPGVAFATTYRT